MIRAHAAAVRERLESVFVPPVEAVVLDGHVPDGAPAQYVVLWTSAPRRFSDRLAGHQAFADSRFQTTCVGTDPDQVRDLQELVAAAFVDARLQVAGRVCARIKHESSQPIREDHDTHHPTVLLGVDQWSLFTVPAGLVHGPAWVDALTWLDDHDFITT